MTEGSPEQLESELRGDAIHIDLADGDTDGRAGLALERLPSVIELTLDGAHLRARVEDGGRAMPAVLPALDEHGIKVASVTMARPRLTTSTCATRDARSPKPTATAPRSGAEVSADAYAEQAADYEWMEPEDWHSGRAFLDR